MSESALVPGAASAPARPAAPPPPAARPAATPPAVNPEYKDKEASVVNGVHDMLVVSYGIESQKAANGKFQIRNGNAWIDVDNVNPDDALDPEEIKTILAKAKELGIKITEREGIKNLALSGMDKDARADAEYSVSDAKKFVETINWYAKTHHLTYEQALEVYKASNGFKMVDKSVYVRTRTSIDSTR